MGQKNKRAGEISKAACAHRGGFRKLEKRPTARTFARKDTWLGIYGNHVMLVTGSYIYFTSASALKQYGGVIWNPFFKKKSLSYPHQRNAPPDEPE